MELSRAETSIRSSARAVKTQKVVRRGLLYILVILASLMFVFPFFWTVSSSLKTAVELMAWPPTMVPKVVQWQNYPQVFIDAPFARFVWNSTFVTILATIGQVLSSVIVAYGFARMRFPGREILFGVCLSTMILPPQVTIIPLFLIFRKVGWIDTFYPLIVPSWFAGAFSVFLLRQFIMTIPYDLDEAAIIDGASRLSILWHVVVPNSGPAIATVAVFSFLWTWNAFLEPFIFLNRNTNFTLPVGLRYLVQIPTGPGLPRDNIMMAACVMATMPIVVLFFVAQRYFVEGIVTTGLKG